MPNKFDEVLKEAVAHFSDKGYTSDSDLKIWIARLTSAMDEALEPTHVANQKMRIALSGVYEKMVTRGGAIKYHEGIKKGTVERLSGRARLELNKRIFVANEVISNRRLELKAKMLASFSGWISSIPNESVISAAERRDIELTIKAPVKQYGMSVRNVQIDQSTKLTAAINRVVADDGGAIAVEWHSDWQRAGYNYRPSHKARDRKVYMLPNTWAVKEGLVKPGANGVYGKDITEAAEEPNCQCHVIFIYNIKRLPEDMLTSAGKRVVGGE